MPEMPEVEQVRKTLAPKIVGSKIKKVEVLLDRIIKYPTVAEFIKVVKNKTITSIERRGKYLALHFSKDQFILIHLRMTGALLVMPKTETAPKYATVKFELENGLNLWFTDIRTFGTMHLITNKDVVIESYENLGPEPLSKEFTLEYLKEKIKKSKKPIKTFILDQNVIAGLGNIYADEALAVANIYPAKEANTLKAKEQQALYVGINQVIKQGIKNKGTTFRDYKDADGNKGSNQNKLLVYSRKGKPCKTCGTLLEGMKIGGRGTVYCKKCQK